MEVNFFLIIYDLLQMTTVILWGVSTKIYVYVCVHVCVYTFE